MSDHLYTPRSSSEPATEGAVPKDNTTTEGAVPEDNTTTEGAVPEDNTTTEGDTTNEDDVEATAFTREVDGRTEGQELYVGVDPIYQTYASHTQAPLVSDDEGDDVYRRAAEREKERREQAEAALRPVTPNEVHPNPEVREAARADQSDEF